MRAHARAKKGIVIVGIRLVYFFVENRLVMLVLKSSSSDGPLGAWKA